MLKKFFLTTADTNRLPEPEPGHSPSGISRYKRVRVRSTALLESSRKLVRQCLEGDQLRDEPAGLVELYQGQVFGLCSRMLVP